jgi:cyclic pyranopterin phosphate synthase
MCHPLALTHVAVDILPVESASAIEVTARTRCHGPTGVEMEALTAVTVALLTIYDMMKAVDRGMRLEAIHLTEKRGGASGEWSRGTG